MHVISITQQWKDGILQFIATWSLQELKFVNIIKVSHIWPHLYREHEYQDMGSMAPVETFQEA